MGQYIACHLLQLVLSLLYVWYNTLTGGTNTLSVIISRGTSAPQTQIFHVNFMLFFVMLFVVRTVDILIRVQLIAILKFCEQHENYHDYVMHCNL